MTYFSRLIAAVLVIAGLSPAVAQVPNFNLPPSTVIGRSAGVTGPAQAIPFSALLAAMLTSPLTVSQVNVNSIIYTGATSGQATVSAQSVAGTPTIKWPTVSGTVVTSGTAPIVVNSVTGAASCPTCTTSVISTRTAAAAQNLTGVSAIQTLGYTTAGDGGGATFKNVTTTPFLDSFVTGTTINAAGSGCTNGTYNGVFFTGGTGAGLQATITVAGGIVTVFTPTGNVGSAFTVNDILSPVVGTGSSAWVACGTTQPSFKITSISTPLCSFSDSAGNHFQLVFQSVLDVRQCGALVNWTIGGGDAGAHDDTPNIQAALSFAYYNTSSSFGMGILGGGGLLGNRVTSPKGWSMIGSTVIIPMGVTWTGQGQWSSGIKLANTFTAATHGIIVCDNLTLQACFGAYMEGFYIQDCNPCSASAGSSLIFSNNIQQGYFLRKVVAAGNNRGCVWLTTGYGGAAFIGMVDVEAGATQPTNNCISINYTSAQVKLDSLIVESSTAGVAASGVAILGGHILMTNFHCENYVNCIFVATTAGLGRYQNLTGGGTGCTNLLVRSGGLTNVSVIASASRNGCTNTLNNGGALTTADIVADVVF